MRVTIAVLALLIAGCASQPPAVVYGPSGPVPVPQFAPHRMPVLPVIEPVPLEAKTFRH